LEYNFENDPNIHTWYDGFHLWVEFQYSNVDDLPCDNSQNYSRLAYSIYALYFDVSTYLKKRKGEKEKKKVPVV